MTQWKYWMFKATECILLRIKNNNLHELRKRNETKIKVLFNNKM